MNDDLIINLNVLNLCFSSPMFNCWDSASTLLSSFSHEFEIIFPAPINYYCVTIFLQLAFGILQTYDKP